jgi:hypothetical protein
MSKIRLSKKLREAFRRYYHNWRHQKTVKWDKQADFENIENLLPKNCVWLQAIAGTFWLTWRRPRIQTTHDEKNYWCCKILARLRKGKWVSAR